MSTDPATDDDNDALAANGRPTRRLALGRLLWIANLAALGTVVLWVLFDPKQYTAVQTETLHFDAKGLDVAVFSATAPGPRGILLLSVVAIAALTTAGILATLFVGARRHRSIRSWLSFTLLIAAWLTLLVGWREIAWQGQQLRLGSMVAQFDSIAKSLRENWPTSDGEREGLGSFMAYPQGNPRMLMMLVSRTDPQISAIERADDGSLGFEIRGEQPGTWLEWHPPGSQPVAFVGGLEDDHDLRRISPLGDGWFQVRYGQRATESPDNTSNNHR